MSTSATPADRFPHPHPDPIGRHPELPDGIEPGGGRPGWRPWSAVLALVSAFAGALLGALILGVIGVAVSGGDFQHTPGWVNLAATVVQDACFIGAALLFARAWRVPRPEHFGLRPAPVRRAIGYAVVAWLGFYAFTAAFIAILGLHPHEEDIKDQLGVGGASGLAAVAVLVTVVAPVAEEFFFRGYFFSALRNWKGLWPAAIITGLVFGGIHAGGSDPAYLVPLASFGIALCLLYERTGSLWPCIALHCANNSVAFGASEHWSWQIPLLYLGALAVIAVLGRTALQVWQGVIRPSRA